MTGVFEGFATIGVVIAVGALLAHLGVFGLETRDVLTRLSFFVGSPALMAVTLSGADVHGVLSGNLVASVAGVAVAAATYAALARWLWRLPLGESVIGALAASYVNAGNLGIPIATYVLGDAALVAPTLLLQLLVLQPLALMLLDRDRVTSRGSSRAHAGRVPAWLSVLSRPFRNPLTVGSLAGLLLALTGLRLPTAVSAPLELLGALAVPCMLIAYGISLRLGPGLGSGGAAAQIGAATVLKLVVQPVVAWLVAAVALGLSGHALLAVVVTSALPTAQNIFTHATLYRRGELVARDTILLTTAGSVPVILLIALVLG